MGGDFPGGHRLQIRELAADLGISVMPVREAIKRLEAMGLVEELPYRGAVVKTLGLGELLHVYAVRKLLEVEAAVLGAPTVEPESVLAMKESYAAMADALERGEVADYLDRDEDILARVYEASGNPVLLDTIRGLWSRCRPFKIAGVRRQLELGEREPLLGHQRGLIDAVERASAVEAGRVTTESLDAAIERIRSAIADE